jgi:hypothetical protein
VEPHQVGQPARDRCGAITPRAVPAEGWGWGWGGPGRRQGGWRGVEPLQADADARRRGVGGRNPEQRPTSRPHPGGACYTPGPMSPARMSRHDFDSSGRFSRPRCRPESYRMES